MDKMKKHWLANACSAALFAGTSLNAAEAKKSYQVTGPILELTATTITVQKGDDKWEIARNKDTKITGDLKVGSALGPCDKGASWRSVWRIARQGEQSSPAA